MRKLDVEEILKDAIQDETLPYELKNEMWSNIDRKVGAMRMSNLKRSSRHVQTALAWIGTVAVVASVAIVGWHFILHRHATSYTTASNDVGNYTGTNNTKANNQANQQTEPNTTQNPSASSPISQRSYSNSNGAIGAITSLEQSFGQFYPSGPPVNLGLGINAEFSGGAGQYSYRWNEGRWTILARFWGSNTPGTQVVKNMVAYLHTHMLPAPENVGIIIISQPSSSMTPTVSQNTIAWQVGNTVYELQQTGNPIAALETVVKSNHS